MSFLSTVQTDLNKAFAFLGTVFQKTEAVDKAFVSLAPATKAAILATFYDATKTATDVAGVVTDVASGNIPGAITLSSATVAMVQNVVADGKADLTALQNIVATLKTV